MQLVVGDIALVLLGGRPDARALDEIDYGLILVDPNGTLQHANHLARHELARSRFLRIDHRTVTSQCPLQAGDVLRGIRMAARRRRQMLNLASRDDALAVACVPLFQPYEGESASVLMMLGFSGLFFGLWRANAKAVNPAMGIFFVCFTPIFSFVQLSSF